jgi:hypothetical protein
VISSIRRSWSILLQTVPGASRSLFLFIILTHTANAIIDVNSNGVSDLWEKTYNLGSLFTNFAPLADPDGDDWTNATEAISGTDPFNANTPTGILRPQIIQSPAVYVTGTNGEPEIFTPAAVSITWPTFAGKQYTLFTSVDLSQGSWLAIDNETPRIGTTAPMGNAFPISQPDGSSPPAMFYRLAINDADSDGDTLTNHEEAQLQTDPFSIDTDLDGLPDNTDPAPLISQTLTDPDGAGLLNAQNLPTSLANGLLGRWNFEDHQIISNPPAGYTPFQYPDSVGTNPATSFSVFPHPEGMVSKATNHAGGYVSIPTAVLGTSKIYTTAFWALLEPGSIANANGAPVALFSHHQRIPWLINNIPQWGRYTEQLNGIWFEKFGNQERLRAGTHIYTNHLNGVPTAGTTTSLGINILRNSGTADDGKWHHYAFVHNDGIKTLYIDGVLVGTATHIPATISINSIYSGISLGRFSGPSPAAIGYFQGTSPTRGRIDRLRIWNRPVTQTEATALYREDIDKDGLWDITENNRLWRDNNSDGLETTAERTFSSSPFTWQPTTSDTDDDGLTDIQEQTRLTKIDDPDTDGDLLPDGWEVDYQLNPLVPNNPNSDTDQDGLTLLDEYRYNTNPTLANTDGDTQNDGAEVGQGSNPNDSSDGGTPIPAEEKLSILLGIGDESGSESEDYVLNCYRLDPATGQETRIYTLRSGGYGEYKEETQSIFKKGESYTFQIDWQSSSLGYRSAAPGVSAEGPDYDYTFKVQPQGSNTGILIDAYDPKTKTIGNPILAEDASDVATTESEFEQNYESKRVMLQPVELIISHPEVESVVLPSYSADADVRKVKITVAASPTADGTTIDWEITQGNGSLSNSETTTKDGFSSTILTTSTNAGDTYKVRARVKKLLLPPSVGQTDPLEINFPNSQYDDIEKETAAITVIPGFASSITVERQINGVASGAILKADGKSEMTLIATLRDQYGQPVETNTPVVWHLGGSGKVIPLADGTDSDGKIRAKLIAGNASGQQKIRIEASGFEVTEVIENEAAGTGLSAGASSLDISTHQTTALTASFPGVADGAIVKWFSSRGEIVNAAATVQSGQATASLRATGGRIGAALVTASVGSRLLSTEIAMISSAPISVEVVNPVIVGDENADGTTSLPRLDGTLQVIPFQTSTAVKIKASAFPGMPATVRFGSMAPNVVARYRFEQMVANQVTDEINANSASVTGAVLDNTTRHEGTSSLSFDGDDSITIPDSLAVRARLGFSISLWLHATEAAGNIVQKSGEYRLFIDSLGKVVFGITTSTGEQLVVGPNLPIGRWSHIQAELFETGALTVSIDGVKSTAQISGSLIQASAQVNAGSGMVGLLDLLEFANTKSFVEGPGLNVTGLSSGQVVLDANGEATINVNSIGQGLVNANSPVATMAMSVSINPSLVVEDTVIVATRKAFAELDATMGEVKITTGSQTSDISEGIRKEVVAKSLLEFERTGQRSAAIPFEPAGNIIERRQFGFRASLWLEETVDGASQVKLVMENVDRLNLTPEQEAQLPEQMNSLLMEAIKGGSDEGAKTLLEDKYGGILETLALLSEQDSFRAFTILIDGQEIFFDLGYTHELLGPQIVKDLAKLAKLQESNPTFGQRFLSIVSTWTDVITGQFQERAFATANEFMLVQVNAAVAEGKLNASQAFDIGFGWGLFEQGQALSTMSNTFAAQRMGEQMAATITAAIHGSQEARDALAEAIPFYGLKRMDNAANALAEQGKYFEAGKKSSEFTTASIGSVLVAGQAVKGSVNLFRAAKMVAKVKPRIPRIPASFGRNPTGKHYTDVFYEGNQKLNLNRSDYEVHHAVDQRSLDLYGNLLSRSEMDSIQNLRGIKKGLIDAETQKPLHQSTIQKHWNRFHKEHLINGTTPTKQQLLDFATHIDDLFGHLFTPPMR